MATITSTAGGSGQYTLGAVTGVVTLFTTPVFTDAIFIVYITSRESTQPTVTTKIMVGPNTDVKWSDSSSLAGEVTFNWVQMVIS